MSKSNKRGKISQIRINKKMKLSKSFKHEKITLLPLINNNNKKNLQQININPKPAAAGNWTDRSMPALTGQCGSECKKVSGGHLGI